MRFSNSSYKLKAEKLNSGQNIETLILGGSHAYYGINPNYLNLNSFNAAHVSQSLDIDYNILQNYKFPKLKYVILPISYPTLYYTIKDCNIGDEKKRMKKYDLYYNLQIKSHSDNIALELFNDNSHGLGKLKKICSSIKNMLVNEKANINSFNGFGTEYKNRTKLDTNFFENSAKGAVKRHTLINSKNQHTECKLYLNKIVNHCTKNNIKLFLVLTPTTSFYYSELNQKQLMTTMNICLNHAKLNENVIFLNYLNDSYYNLSDFYDGDHLSNRGAKKLSIVLRENIKRTINQL